MRPASLASWGATRAFRAVVLIVTLFLGGTFHEWHHAIDPHCDGSSSAEHACGCSVMHAAALVAAALDAPAPASSEADAPATVAHAAPATVAHALASPRAPPAA